ncbi:MAG: TraR/DksA family transcriptional regulator [Desulfobacteraceae bacterium]|nr:TraR/DksA family transcriptional regulator [Desulfobacteraceae bacterium]
MDEIDQAQSNNEDFQAFALKLNQRKREPGNYTGVWCLDCDEVIPEKRRQAVPGCRRCIDCQETFEMEAA